MDTITIVLEKIMFEILMKSLGKIIGLTQVNFVLIFCFCLIYMVMVLKTQNKKKIILTFNYIKY